MNFIDTSWRLRPDLAQGLSPVAAVGSEGVLQRVLAVRGLDEDAPSLSLRRPHDPFRLRGMAEAIETLHEVIDARGRILIHGDYDCDGMGATAILVRALGLYLPPAGIQVHVPNRLTEGYGLSEEGVRRCLEEDIDLLITVDCGIRSIEEVRILREAGVKVIVTDHHEPGPVLPDAESVINPHQPLCTYPCRDLAGAGVAWKLSQALFQRIPVSHSIREDEEAIQALATLGTLADQMTLLDENRYLVKEGLAVLQRGGHEGLQVLLKTLQLEVDHLTSTDIVFSVAPKINAAGRLGQEQVALGLLTGGAEDLGETAQRLLALNDERKEVEQQATLEARSTLQREGLTEHPILMVAGDDWHLGVLGIVAAKLTEDYGRPAIVLTRVEGDPDLPLDHPDVVLKGSGRSTDSFHLLDLVSEHRAYLESCGGHASAIGLSVRGDQWAPFRRAVLQGLEHRDEGPAGLNPRELHYDLELPAPLLSQASAERLQALEPYGQGNSEPIFRTDGWIVREIRALGKEGHHLRLVLQAGGSPPVQAIAFGMGEWSKLIAIGDSVDLLYRIALNHWRGRSQLQLNVLDLHLPKLRDTGREGAAPRIEQVTPPLLKQLWRLLDAILGNRASIVDLPYLTRCLQGVMHCSIEQNAVLLSIKVFAECALLTTESLGYDRYLIQMNAPTKRVSLQASPTYCEILGIKS